MAMATSPKSIGSSPGPATGSTRISNDALAALPEESVTVQVTTVVPTTNVEPEGGSQSRFGDASTMSAAVTG